jgi:hypothetical protein
LTDGWVASLINAQGDELMYDLAAFGIAAGCFAFSFFLVYVLERV